MRTDFFRKIEDHLSARLPISQYCRVVNVRNAVRGKKHRLSPAHGEDPALHIVDDGIDQIHICRMGRHNRYKRGIVAGVEHLARQYSLNLLSDLRDGTFIDCGANVGELGIWARQRGFRYIAFEPELLEARCVNLNNFNGQEACIRKALWKEEAELRFYNRADKADSSVFGGDGEESFVVVPATTLDAAVDLSDVSGPVIFKLEAEGAEPEVLEGATRALSRIDWVAVDCGFERGPENAHTFVETNTILHDHGFRLVAAEFSRITSLYRRIA